MARLHLISGISFGLWWGSAIDWQSSVTTSISLNHKTNSAVLPLASDPYSNRSCCYCLYPNSGALVMRQSTFYLWNYLCCCISSTIVGPPHSCHSTRVKYWVARHWVMPASSHFALVGCSCVLSIGSGRRRSRLKQTSSPPPIAASNATTHWLNSYSWGRPSSRPWLGIWS